jgi:hypothetical protein
VPHDVVLVFNEEGVDPLPFASKLLFNAVGFKFLTDLEEKQKFIGQGKSDCFRAFAEGSKEELAGSLADISPEEEEVPARYIDEMAALRGGEFHADESRED